MFYVIRNGEYLETDTLLFNDVKVPQRPHENAIYMNGAWIFDADSYLSKIEKEEAQEFLNNTDWKITRHKEQQDLGIETSLTDDEYLELITQRQERRAVLNDIAE